MTTISRSNVSYESMDFTVDRYHAMIDSGVLGPDDRVELLHGKIVPMSPVGRLHAACVLAFQEHFYERHLGQFTIRTQDPITLSPLSEPQPDVVVARYDPGRYVQGHPSPKDIHLVIEVSDRTLEKDQTLKLEIYARAGIAEYWIVNLVERQFLVYTHPTEDGDYLEREVYEEGQRFEHELLGTIDITSYLPRLLPPVG